MLTYRYFADPALYAPYSVEPRQCYECQRTAPGFRDGDYFVCEDCLAAGRLAESRAPMNSAEVYENSTPLAVQLRAAHPSLSDDEIAAVCDERLNRIRYRTPPLVTWQGLEWPTHCGDFGRFLKRATKHDLQALAPDGNGEAFLASHVSNPDGAHALWTAVREDNPYDPLIAWSLEVYLFQCLHCGEYIVHPDCY